MKVKFYVDAGLSRVRLYEKCRSMAALKTLLHLLKYLDDLNLKFIWNLYLHAFL